jgi:hypothetical protein
MIRALRFSAGPFYCVIITSRTPDILEVLIEIYFNSS